MARRAAKPKPSKTLEFDSVKVVITKLTKRTSRPASSTQRLRGLGSISSALRRSSKRSETYFRNTRPSTTCLYSLGS